MGDNMLGYILPEIEVDRMARYVDPARKTRRNLVSSSDFPSGSEIGRD